MPSSDETPEPDHDSWIESTEVAELLGVTRKTLYNMERRGELHRRDRVRGGGLPPIAVYHREQVARLRDAQGNGRPIRVPPPASRVPLTHRVYLTLEEAVEYSGLPEEDLRDLMKKKELRARPTKNNGVRVRRRDLDRL